MPDPMTPKPETVTYAELVEIVREAAEAGTVVEMTIHVPIGGGWDTRHYQAEPDAQVWLVEAEGWYLNEDEDGVWFGVARPSAGEFSTKEKAEAALKTWLSLYGDISDNARIIEHIKVVEGVAL